MIIVLLCCSEVVSREEHRSMYGTANVNRKGRSIIT
jgi:hypothetical protein